MRGANNALETINAAATAIAAAESNRVSQSSAQKRRLGSCWSIYWCFGSRRHNKRIGHAVLVPETTGTDFDAPAENSAQAASVALPFVAPPSSPASFILSETPSATQSPVGLLSLTSVSACMYSPGGPNSIFANGPYAHETQLVSPPVFSTFTTEPSTAPFTPPPESIQLTTPSSPEVPFAQLLEPKHQSSDAGQRFSLSHHEFQSYHLHPGSPIGQLISPSSGVSGAGTSSPFPDREFSPGYRHFLEFQTGNPPKLLDHDKLSPHEWKSRQGSGTLTPDALDLRSPDSFFLDLLNSNTAQFTNSGHGLHGDETVVSHRVSFEMTAEEVVRCGGKRPAVLPRAVSSLIEKAEHASDEAENSTDMANAYECQVRETSDRTSEKASADEEAGPRHRKRRSLSLGSFSEFNFVHADGGISDRPNISYNWWSNERVPGKEVEPCKNWSLPTVQPGIG